MAVILVSEVTVSPLLEPFRQPVCPGITLRVAPGVADEDRAHGEEADAALAQSTGR